MVERLRLPSLTAEVVTLCRAIEHRRPPSERIVDDPYAHRFLTPTGRAALAAWAAAGPAASVLERFGPGGVTFVACRHRYIDDAVLTAVQGGAERVLLLGAGYDTRAYRLAALGEVPVFEVDLAGISRRKARIVSAGGFPGASPRRVEIDFEHQTLDEALPQAGFELGLRTAIVWEGVSMYLSRAAVKATVRALHGLCGPGSTLAMDCWHYVDDPGAMGTARRTAPSAIALIGEPVRFGIHPEDVAPFLASLGFRVTDVAGATELAARYVTDGRPIEPSVYVLTAQRDRRPGSGRSMP